MLRSGLSHLPRFPGGEPHVKSLRSPATGAGFLLIAQSVRLSRPGELSRSGVLTALRGFQHMVRFYFQPSSRSTPDSKSVALPTELPARPATPTPQPAWAFAERILANPRAPANQQTAGSQEIFRLARWLLSVDCPSRTAPTKKELCHCEKIFPKIASFGSGTPISVLAAGKRRQPKAMQPLVA